MKFLNKSIFNNKNVLTRSKLKQKYWAYIFAAILIFDISITLLLFSLYSNTLLTNATDSYIKNLEQTCNSFDNLKETLDIASRQIIQDPYINKYFIDTSVDRLNEIEISFTLKEIQASYHGLRYVSVYNSDSQRIISNSCVSYLDETDNQNYSKLLRNSSMGILKRDIGHAYFSQEKADEQVYTFLFPINSTAQIGTNFAIFDISDTYIESLFSSDENLSESETIYILDDELVPISTISSEKNSTLYQDFRINSNLLDEISTGSSNSYTFTDSSGTKKLAVFTYSQNANVYIVYTENYDYIMKDFTNLAIVSSIMFLIILILGFFISRFIASYMYRPIKELYDKFSDNSKVGIVTNELTELNQIFTRELEQKNNLEYGLVSTYSDSQRLYLESLLSGEIEKISNFKEICNHFKIDISAKYFTIIKIRYDIPTIDKSTFFIVQYALENVATELLQSFGYVYLLRTQEDIVTILIASSSEIIKNSERLLIQSNKINDVMKSEFSLPTTICIGSVVEGFESINLCDESTSSYLSSSPISLQGTTFIQSENFEQLSSTQYYNKLYLTISEFVRNYDINACNLEFDKAITNLSNVDFHTVKVYISHLLFSVLDEFSSVLNSENERFNLLMEDINKVHSTTNIKVLKAITIDFLRELIHLLESNKKFNHEDSVEKVCLYISKNYSDPNISLRMLADIVNLSPAYLGKIFTANTTYTFNDYLMNVRMEEAAKLLKETKLPIPQISDKVGMLNVNYFYSVFKKKFSTTPTTFRKNKNFTV